MAEKIAWACDHIPVPEAPQTIKQNWIPFLTFFFLRILICRAVVISIYQKGVMQSTQRSQHTALSGEDIISDYEDKPPQE